MKKGIVIWLEWLCTVLDAIPQPQRIDGEWDFSTRSGLGCLLGVAKLSDRLDERWRTGVWFLPETQTDSWYDNHDAITGEEIP